MVQTMEVEWFASRSEALRAEALAIQLENPKWNVKDGEGMDRECVVRPLSAAEERRELDRKEALSALRKIARDLGY